METTSSEILRSVRRRTGLTQAELARRAGIPRSVLNAYEHGRREPGANILARIVGAAGHELRAEPVQRVVDPERAARILSQVLDFAESFPRSRPPGPLAYPSMKRSLG